MGKLIDLTGQRFGHWTVLSRDTEYKGKASHWMCQCDCGTVQSIDGYSLRHASSTQCYKCSRKALKRHKEHNSNYTGSRKHLSLYHVWRGMKSRCYNPHDKSFKNYGERGISVCQQWKDDFTAFMEWSLKNGYQKGLQIDRIDNNGNYEPQNCRWVTQKENSNNTRKNRMVCVEMTIAQYAELFHLDYHVAYYQATKHNFYIKLNDS